MRAERARPGGSDCAEGANRGNPAVLPERRARGASRARSEASTEDGKDLAHVREFCSPRSKESKGFLCGGVSDGFDVDFRTLAGTGTCVLEAKSLDSWGSEGTDRLTFRVQ